MAEPVIPDSSRWPSVFFAFKHTDNVLILTARMRNILQARRITARRLVDFPRPGTNLRTRAEELIAGTDGTVLFWSKLGAESDWVKAEYRYARDVAHKPICLILFPGVERPSDWDPDVEWVPLEGVRFRTPHPGRPSFFSPVFFTTDFENTLKKVVAFALYSNQVTTGST